MVSQLEIFIQIEDEISKNYGLSVAECFFLIYLQGDKKSELSTKVSRYISEAERGLTEKDLLMREEDKLRITLKGEELLADINRSKGDVLGQMYNEGISWDEMEVFFTTVEKLNHLLQDSKINQ